MDEEYALLSERQREQAESYVDIALEYGKWDQSSMADGSHYAPADANPFKASGLICKNCVFYDDLNGCQIVSGVIEEEAICKLWIIPEQTIQETEASNARMLILKKKVDLFDRA